MFFFSLHFFFLIENSGKAPNVDDVDDAASDKSSTSSSVRSCKVILERENFDDVLKSGVGDDGRTVAHSTRARSSSQLTVENVSAHMNPARRALRSASVASDGTGSVKSRTTRASARVAASQNTPKKGSTTPRPATPSRRSSRLLSENEKAVDSPAKSQPAKRNLRSNSVASSVDDVSPPPQAIIRTRSSRLSESQDSPSKALKDRLVKIKMEPTTPNRRASSRFNKSSVMTDIIDEELSDDEKSKNTNKTMMKPLDEIEETVPTSEVEPQSTSMEMEHSKDDEATATVDVQQNVSVTDKLAEAVSSAVADGITESESADPINADAQQPTTPKPAVIEEHIEQTDDMSMVESAAPMETSLAEHTEQVKTPKAKKETPNKETPHTPESTTPKTPEASNQIDSVDVTAVVSEEILSPKKSNTQQQQQTPIKLEQVQVKMEETTDSNADEMPKALSINDALTEILKSYTPKPKSRPSAAYDAMNVSALVHDEQMDVGSSPMLATATSPASKQLKVSPKRLSLNSTTQSTGFDQLEVSTLVDMEKESVEFGTPDKAELETTNENAESPRKKNRLSIVLMSSEKSPNTTGLKERPDIASPSKVGTTPKIMVSKAVTPKSATPKHHASPKKTPIAEPSLNLTAMLSPSVKTDCDSTFNDIASNLTPGQSESNVNKRIDEIFLTLDDMVMGEAATEKQQAVSEEKTVDTSSYSDKHDVSVIENTQPDLDETTPQTEVVQTEYPTPITKSAKKSVQIMTPQNQKSHSAGKRIDTPYPSSAARESANSPSELHDGNKSSSNGKCFSFIT